MKVPLAWLREFVEIPVSVDDLVERLPMLGLGVDGIEHVAGDIVLDLEIASNRPDLLSLVGVARELAAWGGHDVRLPADIVEEHDPAAAGAASVEITDAALCPRYVAHVIEGVTVGPSPRHIATRLDAAGIRPINNVVDATNYAMLVWGQPQHAFDLDTLAERRIIVRPARPGEVLTTLDGAARPLDSQTLVIADARRAVALAGIMGGAETEIGPGTRTVLLEAASFAPASVRRTARRLGLRTEASARFERGIDPEVTMRAARGCARLMAELAGGRLLRGAIDVYPAPSRRSPILLRLGRIARLLGTEVPVADVLAILARLGFEVRPDGAHVRALPPVGRRDLEREEDLIEEIARHYGYDRIPETMPREIMQPGHRPVRLDAEAAARDALIRAGLTEAMTVSLITPRLLDRFGLTTADPWRRAVPIQNPLTADHTHLRTCLLPGLLDAVRANVSRRRDSVHLFEVGRVFAQAATGAPVERKALAVAMRGRWLHGLWDARDGGGDVSFFNLRGVLEALAAELHAGVFWVEPLGPGPDGSGAGAPAWLHPGRSGRAGVGDVSVGVLGELHPDVAASFDLPGRTYVAEVDLDALLDRTVLQPRFAGVPRHQAVRRDVAVIAPLALPNAAVEAALRETVGDLLETVELFDVYEGPPLEPGRRNLAYALSFRAPDRTLTGEEVEELVARVHAALPGRLPVTIRT